MMECQHARLLLEFARPNSAELEADESRALEEHLESCVECGHFAASERRLDHVVGRALRDIPVPEGLRNRLLQRLTTERDDWYRKWLVRGVGIAAAIVVAVWLGQIWWHSRLPGVDGQMAADNHQPFNSAAQVEDWFRMRRITMAAPPGFNYELLNAHNVALFQGEHVPHLVFFAPARGKDSAAIAHVYVLSDRQFDLEKTLSAASEIYAHRHSIVVEKHPDNSSFVYLIVTTSKNPEPFRGPQSGRGQ